MKKLFISLLAMAATLNAMAIDYEAKAKLKLTSTTSQTCEVTIAQIAGSVSKYCAEMNMQGRKVALYAIGSKNFEIFAANDLEGTALGLMTDAATDYTISFSNLAGATKLYLVDAVANKTTEITAGGSYAFTAEANQTIADRFSITKVLPAKPYSFINNTLVITEATGLVTVTPFTYAEGGKSLGTPENHDPSAPIVLSGNYFLVTYETAEGTREFIVNANPDVQPANN